MAFITDKIKEIRQNHTEKQKLKINKMLNIGVNIIHPKNRNYFLFYFKHCLSKSLKNDKNYLFSLFKQDRGLTYLLDQMDYNMPLLKNKEFLIELMPYSTHFFKMINWLEKYHDHPHKNDIELIRAAVKADSTCYRYLSDQMQKDFQIVNILLEDLPKYERPILLESIHRYNRRNKELLNKIFKAYPTLEEEFQKIEEKYLNNGSSKKNYKP